MFKLIEVLFFIVFCSLLLWFYESLKTDSTETVSVTLPNQTLYGLTLYEWETVGDWSRLWQSQKAVYRKSPLDVLHLNHIDLSWRADLDAPPWQVNARRGEVLLEQNHVKLNGDIALERARHNNQPAMILKTQHFLFDLDTKKGHTEAPVYFNAEALSLNGIGAKVDFAEGNVKLQQQVEASYELQ